MLSHHLIVISFNLFHINPSQYADFKSLTGDVSDNIKSADSIDKPSIKDSISNSFIPFLFWQHKNSFSKNLIRNQHPQSYLHSIYMHKHIRPACVTVHPPRIQLLLSMSVMHKKGGVNKKSFYFLYFVSILRYAIIITITKIITPKVTKIHMGEFCCRNKKVIPIISTIPATTNHNIDTALL